MKKYTALLLCFFAVPAFADTCSDWGTSAGSASNYKIYSSNGGTYCSSYTTKYMYNQTTKTRIQYAVCNACSQDGYIPTEEVVPEGGGYGCSFTLKPCRQCPQGTYGGGDYDNGTSRECYACSETNDGDYTLSDSGATSYEQCYRECKRADVPNASIIESGGRYYSDGTNTCSPMRCNSKYYKNGNYCESCPSTFPNSYAGSDSAAKCYKACTSTSIASGTMYNDGTNTCQASNCNAGYYRSGNSCLGCPSVSGLYTDSALKTVAKSTSLANNSGGVASCYVASGTYYDATGSFTIDAPENACAAGANFDITTVDKSESGTSYSSNSTAKTWYTQFSYGTISGVSTCVATSATSVGTVKPANTFSEFDTSGMYCWCKMTAPAQSGWVYYSSMGTAQPCESVCASQCAYQAGQSATFRTNMYNSI